MRILITGGTGSFGSKMIQKLVGDPEVELIRVFSRDEKKQYDMRTTINSDKIEYVIGDMRDFDSVESAMKGIDTIFHAAALKQVPTGEFFPSEMIKTNVLGTQNLVRAVDRTDSIKKAVLLSTDKAVFPINTMGITKALAEKLFNSKSDSKNTIFNIVRYGNVMASRGSVIPLFVEKLLAGNPITITDPNMTRFMLSLDDAIDLVLFAIQNGKSGDLFVKKAPAATVGNIALALSQIFNVEYKPDVIGVRAGEKIHETLVTQGELSRSQDMEDYYRVFPETRKQDYESFFTSGSVPVYDEDYTSENTRRLTLEETKELLLSLDFIQQQLSKLK